MSPSQRRRAVHMFQDRLGLSQRRACRMIVQDRSTKHHTPQVPDPDRELGSWLGDFAKKHPRRGYRRAQSVAVREGWGVNRKKIQRMWREEGIRILHLDYIHLYFD